MKRFAFIGLTTLALNAFELSTQGALAAKKDSYAQRNAECKREANSKHFGIYWIKRNRWIESCLARHRT